MKNFLIYAALFFLSLPAHADETKAAPNPSLSINPVMIDSKNGSGSTLGLEYALSGKWKNLNLGSNDAGTDKIDPDATVGNAFVNYSAKGTVAASKDRNPKNLLEFELNGKYRFSGEIDVLSGFFTKYETDQSFTNKQLVYGVTATIGKRNLLAKNDEFAFDAYYGRVDPKGDDERKKALGTTAMNPYNRWDLELLYLVQVKSSIIDTVEFNYRYYLENGASTAIKNADLDKFQLATIRIGLQKDLFIAYSAGKLPFNKKNDQIFQIGLSYKFM
ncbi:hypothetical protein ACO0K9_02195 [Undibacterium sp. Ji50W]|uniref:hypothetical protein n=1 Tax=Undibacterium sp. Ji50W TaxID=3413041 RepID=UPI003BF3E532